MKKLFSEVLKLQDGELYNLPYHQERVNNTTHRFYGTDIDLSGLERIVPEDAKKGLYKFRLLYGERIESFECIPYSVKAKKRVGIVFDDKIEYGYKYADRGALNRLLKQPGYEDVIIIRNGCVTDSLFCNLVFESAEGLFTPQTYLLPGTKRKYLLDREIIRERFIRFEDICRYDRLHFISAMIELEDGVAIPVASLLLD